MKIRKLSKARRFMRIAHLINFLFLFFVVFYYCLELNIETQTVFFNLQNMLLCTPYILLYLLLELWLYPKYIRVRHVRKYSVIGVALVVLISVIWTFLIRPHVISENNDIAFFPFLRWTVCFLMCLTIFFVITSNNMFAFSFLLESEQENLARTKLQLELNLLKYQLNPHFLMNTLNNIHALIEDDRDKAQDAVRTLSKIMRYMYYDTSKERVELAKDLEILQSYFELMKLRYIDGVDFQFNVPEEIPHVKVAPNLFVNIVENAMKHGISYGHASFVHFTLEVDDSHVICKVRNSKYEHKNAVDSTGFGVKSMKKRLDLLYPEQYEYKVEETENEYFVELIIPVQ